MTEQRKVISRTNKIFKTTNSGKAITLYEIRMTKHRHFICSSGKPKNKNLDAIVSDSRRGSLAPPGSSRRGSRQGSISLAGTERRGSYYGDDVSKRATVAVVVNDPDSKANINAALNGEGKKIFSSFNQFRK